MSDMPDPIQGWALPREISVPATEVKQVEGGGRIAWPTFDQVGALRLITSLRASHQAITQRPAASIAAVLGGVGERFLDEADPLHAAAVESVVAESGLSPEMSRHVVLGMAADWTPARLTRLLSEEFGSPEALDGFAVEAAAPTPAKPADAEPPARRVAAFGDEFAFHLASGSVPGVGATSLIRSLLVKTPVLLKPGAGDVALAVLFARALAESDPELADCCAVTYWPGGESRVESVVIPRADRIVVYGDDQTVRAVRDRANPGVPVVDYHHRISFSVVGPGTVDGRELASAAGTFDQRGCVTTHQVYVIGDQARAREVARLLANGLANLERDLPKGSPTGAEGSALRQRVGATELKAAVDDRVELLADPDSKWAVLVEPNPGLEPSPLGRVVRVTPVANIERIAMEVGEFRFNLQTAGHGGFADQGRALANALGRVGVTRVVPFASVAFPPAWWLHDGSGPLQVLVRQAEWQPE